MEELKVKKITLTNEEGTKQIQLSLDSDGNLIFKGEAGQNIYVPGDVIPFSAPDNINKAEEK